jgi:hypothetical protein
MTTTADFARQDRLHTTYGVAETGMPVGPEYHATVSHDERIDLAELARRGGKITRVRWIGGEYVPGRGKCYDLSYVHGQIDGQNVSIDVSACPEWAWIPRRQLKATMIEWAKAERVYAKGLGLLDDGNWSILG